jgi:hypothetical protein
MLLRLAGPAVLVLLFLLPTRVQAGGPPWLSMPLEGVTAENAAACGELLTSKLESKLWPYAGRYRGVLVQEYKGQWYASFFMGENVSLNDVESALKGSDFSVPRQKLRLFGHAILEIESAAKPEEVLADLKAVDHVSVAESETAEGRLRVTVDMPYPDAAREDDRPHVGWETFRWGDFSSDQANRSAASATARTLPSHEAFRKTIERHDARLRDVVWNVTYACRPLGCVAEPVRRAE